MSSKEIGDQSEQLALTHLQNAGLLVITQNYHSRRGEIDLIMSDDDILVFIEVRYRKSARFGSALESINSQKKSRIIHTAQHYIQQSNSNYSGYRFDVVAIDPSGINWIKDAFHAT